LPYQVFRSSPQKRKTVTRKESSDSESDFGDDDDDSDDDYEEKSALKPWQRKASEKRTSSRLDEVVASDGEEEMEDAGDDGTGAGRVVVEASLEDYQKITLPRRRLSRWCNEPYFKDAVVNCFVKLFIGENEQGKRCYRLCKIAGIETNRKGAYALPPVKNQKPVRQPTFDFYRF
jgi:RNA polymerase-associated protein RTF1